MRALAAALVLALLVVAGCGGEESATPTTAPAQASERLAAYEAAVLYSITGDLDPDGAYARQAVEDAPAVGAIAAEHPAATFPTLGSPDGDWTARELLEWASTDGNPEAARAAREALGSLP